MKNFNLIISDGKKQCEISGKGYFFSAQDVNKSVPKENADGVLIVREKENEAYVKPLIKNFNEL